MRVRRNAALPKDSRHGVRCHLGIVRDVAAVNLDHRLRVLLSQDTGDDVRRQGSRQKHGCRRVPEMMIATVPNPKCHQQGLSDPPAEGGSADQASLRAGENQQAAAMSFGDRNLPPVLECLLSHVRDADGEQSSLRCLARNLSTERLIQLRRPQKDFAQPVPNGL